MAIPLIDTAVTVSATLRPGLDWAEGLTGVLVTDRRHPSMAPYDARDKNLGVGPVPPAVDILDADPKVDSIESIKTVEVRVERISGRYVTLTLPVGDVA